MKEMTQDEINQRYYEDGIEDGIRSAKRSAVTTILKDDNLRAQLPIYSQATLIVELLAHMDLKIASKCKDEFYNKESNDCTSSDKGEVK